MKHIKGIMTAKGYDFIGSTNLVRPMNGRGIRNFNGKYLQFVKGDTIVSISRHKIRNSYIVKANKTLKFKKKGGRVIRIMAGRLIDIKSVNQLHNFNF